MRVPARVIQSVAYASGGLTVATGVLHDAMVYTQFQVLESLPQSDRNGSVWLFMCTGTAVAFAGALNISAARGLVRSEPWARRVTLGSSLFLMLLGVSGLALDQSAASSLVALAVLSLIPWWHARGTAMEPETERSAAREAGAT